MFIGSNYVAPRHTWQKRYGYFWFTLEKQKTKRLLSFAVYIYLIILFNLQ